MSWLKLPAAPAPPEPAHVDLERMMHVLTAEPDPPTLAKQYLMTKAPRAQLDKWGAPLPLSAVDQDRLDRVFAVIASPHDRTRALLRAGMLGPDEVDAVSFSFPEIYGELEREALKELVVTAPPYEGWAETVLGILFGKPPAEVIAGGIDQPGKPQQDGQPPPGKPKASGGAPAGMPTPADRRDVAVRAQGNS